MSYLRPFWRYYGGKWRAAPRYPRPEHDTIIEPFAGSAGYSLRYPDRKVILVDCYPVVAEIWRYLIAVSPSEILRIPTVDAVDDLPGWVPLGARYLVGFAMNDATTSPHRTLSAGCRRLRETGRALTGWYESRRSLVAAQVAAIKHWQVIEGDYTRAPDVRATWFIDPPYNNKAGSCYIHSEVDYAALADWCRARSGQVMVCENEGATWAPFESFATLRTCINGKVSREVLWSFGTRAKSPDQLSLFPVIPETRAF
jgi:hypothetical protein